MIRDLSTDEFPPLLREINDPPKSLRYEGILPIEGNKILCIVGSRKYSPYGRESCESLIAGLRGYPITIVSGLALGMDAIAHRAALKNGLQTIAVPGSGLSRKVLYPRSNVNLAEEIIECEGGLMSEFPDESGAAIWTFPQRNRIMAGMSHATIIIEAENKSGTLITSRLASEYNREVGAVPGPIHSSTSDGPHMLIKLGAALIRNSLDILELLNLKLRDDNKNFFELSDLNEEELVFIKLLDDSMPRDKLIRTSRLEVGKANAILSLLEIKGLIIEELGEVRRTF